MQPLTVWFRSDALEELFSLADEWFPLETGGILVGYLVEGADEAVVCSVVGPGPDARHSPTTFEPDGPFHREQLAHAYASSGRVHGYLGDWHSHPHGEPILSWRDQRTLCSIARTPDARAPRPIMFVTGGTSVWESDVLELAPRWNPRGTRRCNLRVFHRASDDSIRDVPRE